MENKEVSRGLELEQDLPFEQKNWVFERVGWVVMLLVVLAALTGLLGSGGISSQTATSSPAGMEAEYQKFMRYHTTDKLLVKVQPPAGNQPYRLQVGHEFMKKMRIEQISPEPASEAVSAQGITYTFDSEPGQGELRLQFYCKPTGWGNLETRLTDGQGRNLTLSHFIYP